MKIKSLRAGPLLTALGPFLGLLLVIGIFSAVNSEVRPFFLTGFNFKISFHSNRHCRHRRYDDDHHQRGH